MALTDLELLQLAERAQEGRKGEPGPPGVGIREIRQPSPDAITIVLSDGRTYDVTLTAGRDGEPGPAGTPGASGERGASGPRGEAGAPGRDGADGMDGQPGASVDSALVNTAGELLVGLTDGQVINCGRVVGPAGATGERGPTGLTGASGRDGNTILSGYQAPGDDQGQDGDFYIDLGSPQYDFYGPKRGGAWGGRTTFLKQPPAPPTQPTRSFLAGGASAGSGGQPPFDLFLPAGVETEIGRVGADQGILLYRVNDTLNLTNWSAGQVSLAAMTDMDDSQFTIASEIYGIGGDYDLVWRVNRVPGNFRVLVIYATAPTDARITGRIVAAT